jgi:hypothetical protein
MFSSRNFFLKYMNINKCGLYENNEFKHFTFIDTSTLQKRSNKL